MTSAIGIDIGGTKIRAARVSSTGEVLSQSLSATAKSADDVLMQVDAAIAELDNGKAVAVGIGVPGQVDVATGRVSSGGYVDLSGLPLCTRLHNLRGRPLVIDNDANMALVTEIEIGAAVGLAHVAMLTIGTGIGGAVVESGRFVRGRASGAQLGHLTVDMEGPICACGRRGCLETASSGTAFKRLLLACGVRPSTTISELLARGDETAASIVTAWARPLRFGIDSLIAAFNPERIVLGGGLGQAACMALQRFPEMSPWYRCEVVPAVLGDRAGAIGAALAALKFIPCDHPSS